MNRSFNRSFKWALIPLVLFLVLVVFLAIGLKRDPHSIPSPLVNRMAPPFSLASLNEGVLVSPQQYKGKVWMLNVWATWCVPCRQEHPALVAFVKKTGFTVVGMNYKEIQRPSEPSVKPLSYEQKLAASKLSALNWLNALGNPYAAVAFDVEGRVGLDYGVYGVPETYVIDKNGMIRFKHVGALTAELLEQQITPLITTLEKS